MGDDIDLVQFGKLIATVESNTEAVKELSGKLESHIETTQARLTSIDQRDEKRKGVILGALGAGTLGGATLGEAVKNIFSHIVK